MNQRSRCRHNALTLSLGIISCYTTWAPLCRRKGNREAQASNNKRPNYRLSNAAEEDTDAAAMATWSMMPNPLLMKHSWADEQKQDIGDGPIEHSSAVPRPRCDPDFSREMMCSGLGDIFDWSPQVCAHEADGSDAREARYNYAPPIRGTASDGAGRAAQPPRLENLT
jgi:hypothetical protein